MIRTYDELSKLPTFEERFKYLELHGKIGAETFGKDRWLNQVFYQRDPEWRSIRNEVIARDLGFDLGVEGFPIDGPVIIHHINPITEYDIIHRTDMLLNKMYLITVSDRTHKAIHYGNADMLPPPVIVRIKNDTCPWRK